MPLTLYWYILRDLLKLLALATGVLVLILTIGFAFAPMSQGLLNPWQLVKVVFYIMPATLPYALPFAAAFATTLVFFRLSADNEVTACAASGISYRNLCVPVATLGLCLTLTMFLLGNWVVPWFWQRVTNLVERDVTGLVITQLKRGNSFTYDKIGGSELVLRADLADIIPTDAAPDGPYRRIGLIGVAAGVFDKQSGLLKQDYTGEKAVIDFYREGDGISAVVRLINPTVRDPEHGIALVEGNRELQVHNVVLPFKHDPRLMSLTQLRKVSAKPELHKGVRRHRDQLLERMAEYRSIAYVTKYLEAGELQLRGRNDEIYRLQADDFEVGHHDIRLTAQDRMPIIMRIGKGMSVRQRLEAKSGRIKFDIDQRTFEPRVLISFTDVKVIDPGLPTPEGRVGTRALVPLSLGEPIMADVDKQDSIGLYNLVAQQAAASPEMAKELGKKGRARALSNQIRRVQNSIRARVNERAASAVNCLLVVVLAAVMAMLLRHQVPLAIFFWCFLPIIASMLLTSSGANFMKDNQWTLPPSISAVSVWVGNLMMVVLITWVYRRLNRN